MFTSKVLMRGRHRVVAVVAGEACPAEEFLLHGEKAYAASRLGLLQMLQHVAENGLAACPSSWFHEANKSLGVYEFIKGDLRLFFFKGKNGDIAICTAGVIKKGRKANESAVRAAGALRVEYEAAVRTNSYEVIEDEDQ